MVMPVKASQMIANLHSNKERREGAFAVIG
jgi:hypothetical protein